jgi:pyruvate formate lyase activating enzyme
VSELRRAIEAGREAGLKYIYVGNVPGERSESTFCPSCGKAVIERFGYSIGGYDLDSGNHCRHCQAIIEGVFDSA